MSVIEQEIAISKLGVLKRAIKVNILVSGILTQADITEAEIDGPLRQALIFTQRLSRRILFCSFIDISTYGNNDQKNLSQELMRKQAVFFQQDILTPDLIPNEELKMETGRFVSDIKDSLPANQYR